MLPFPSQGDLPNSGIELRSPALQADSLQSEPAGKPLLIKTNHVSKSRCNIWNIDSTPDENKGKITLRCPFRERRNWERFFLQWAMRSCSCKPIAKKFREPQLSFIHQLLPRRQKEQASNPATLEVSLTACHLPKRSQNI